MAALVLEDLREEYRQGTLDEAHCSPDPFEQFGTWLQEARASQLREPNAMTLATVGPEGRPSARIVLLKELAPEGLVFYTNYSSRKGHEMEANPHVACTFYWGELERQVRVEGAIEKVPRENSVRYFSGRPRGSRLGALASRQSDPVAGRDVLERILAELEARYYGTDEIPTPEWWGGYLIRPLSFEFWQGRPNRLHDRLVYIKKEDSVWEISRLSP